MQEPHPVQQRLGPGDHWVSFENLDLGIVVFGRVEEVDHDHLISTSYWSELPDGRREVVQRGKVWPIEERLFDMGRAANWNHAQLEEVGRFLLELAYQQQRVAQLPVRGQIWE